MVVDLSALGFVFNQESVDIQCFLNGDLVFMLDHLLVLEVESVQLHAKYFGKLFNPFSLFSLSSLLVAKSRACS